MTASLIHNSRTTHGVLSESSVTAHDRKGRERKGRELEGNGKGGRVETLSSSVTYLDARAADGPSPTESHDGMMPATRQGWAV